MIESQSALLQTVRESDQHIEMICNRAVMCEKWRKVTNLKQGRYMFQVVISSQCHPFISMLRRFPCRLPSLLSLIAAAAHTACLKY